MKKELVIEQLQLTDMEAINYLFDIHKNEGDDEVTLFDIVNAIAKKFPNWKVKVIVNTNVKKRIAINHKYGSLVYSDRNGYFQLYDKVRNEVKGDMIEIIPAMIALMEIEDEYANNR